MNWLKTDLVFVFAVLIEGVLYVGFADVYCKLKQDYQKKLVLIPLLINGGHLNENPQLTSRGFNAFLGHCLQVFNNAMQK